MSIGCIRNTNDLQNKRKEYAEYLQLMIDNESIKEKRIKDYKNPNKPPAVPPQYKTVAEQNKDLQLQEKQAIDNAKDLGLDISEARSFVIQLEQKQDGIDNLVKLNRNFPAFKKLVSERLNPKSLEANAVLNLWEEFSVNLNALTGLNSVSNGALNAYTNSNDNYKKLPYQDDIRGFENFVNENLFNKDLISFNDTLQSTIRNSLSTAKNLLLNKETIDKIDDLSSIEISQINKLAENLLSVYKIPTKNDLEAKFLNIGKLYSETNDSNAIEKNDAITKDLVILSRFLSGFSDNTIQKRLTEYNEFINKKIGGLYSTIAKENEPLVITDIEEELPASLFEGKNKSKPKNIKIIIDGGYYKDPDFMDLELYGIDINNKKDVFDFFNGENFNGAKLAKLITNYNKKRTSDKRQRTQTRNKVSGLLSDMISEVEKRNRPNEGYTQSDRFMENAVYMRDNLNYDDSANIVSYIYGFLDKNMPDSDIKENIKLQIENEFEKIDKKKSKINLIGLLFIMDEKFEINKELDRILDIFASQMHRAQPLSSTPQQIEKVGNSLSNITNGDIVELLESYQIKSELPKLRKAYKDLTGKTFNMANTSTDEAIVEIMETKTLDNLIEYFQDAIMQKRLSPSQEQYYQAEPYYEEPPPPKSIVNKRKLELESQPALRKQAYLDYGGDAKYYAKFSVPEIVEYILNQEAIEQQLGPAFPNVIEESPKYKIPRTSDISLVGTPEDTTHYLIDKIGVLSIKDIYERIKELFKEGMYLPTQDVSVDNGKTFTKISFVDDKHNLISQSEFFKRYKTDDDLKLLRRAVLKFEFGADSYTELDRFLINKIDKYLYNPEREPKYPKQGFGMKKKGGDLIHIDIGSHIGKNYKEAEGKGVKQQMKLFEKVKKNYQSGGDQPYIKSRIKIGSGVAVAEKEPTYQEFGKFVIHVPQLRKNILNFKYASGSRPQYLPIVNVDDDTKELLITTLETGRMSENQFNKLPQPAKDFLIKAIKGAGLQNQLFKGKDKLYATEEKEDRDRFNILKGEFDAGNDNPNLIKELRGLVIKFIDTRIIPKKQGLEFLRQLN